MKVESIGNKKINGFSVLEVLIAMAILTLAISAAIMLMFSNQSVALDSDTANEALYKAKTVLEDGRSKTKSHTDFDSIKSITYPPDSIYTKKFSVLSVPCMKKTISQVTWSTEVLRPQIIEVRTYLSDVEEALKLAGECDPVFPTEWDNPYSPTSVGIGGQGATDLDVQNNLIYLASDPSAPPKEDFFIYQFDPIAVTLTFVSKIDVSDGLMALDFSGGYVYAANEDIAAQLLVIDADPPGGPLVASTASLPDAPTGVIRSVYVYDNKLYVGTQYLPCPVCPPEQNNELHIYGLTDPANPAWLGSYNVNHNINDIVVSGDYAYLATSDNLGELHVYNISIPLSITLADTFDAPGNEDGEAVFLLDNKVYLGRDRTPAARKDFYIFNIINPNDVQELGSKNLGLNPGTTVEGIIVRGNLAFIALDNPTAGLQILNISNPGSIVDHTICTTLNFSENSTAIDMEGNFIFSANRSNDELRVIQDKPTVCF
mgnify:CR=1 FL=1